MAVMQCCLSDAALDFDSVLVIRDADDVVSEEQHHGTMTPAGAAAHLI